MGDMADWEESRLDFLALKRGDPVFFGKLSATEETQLASQSLFSVPEKKAHNDKTNYHLVMEEEMLDALVHQLLIAKQAEEKCRSDRIYIEERIAELIPGPDSEQKTIKLKDGTGVTVKRGWNYKAQCVEIEEWCGHRMLPPPVKTKTTRELDEKGYRYYEENDPQVFRELTKFVTATPKKVSIEVKRK